MAQFNSLLVTGNSRFLNPINGNARNGVYQVIGTQTAATGSWTGNIPVPALYDGLTILYYLPYNGSGSATLNLTLSDGTTTGAVNCYYRKTERLTTHFPSGSNIVLTYYSAGSIKYDGTATTDNRWIANANYLDGNDQAYNDRIIYVRAAAGSNKVFPYTVVMRLPDGRWESIVTSASTATNKARNTHGFLFGQIAWMNYNETYNENSVITEYRLWTRYTNVVDYRYFCNVDNNSTYGLTANKPVYLVGSIGADGLFYLDTTWWTQTLPSTADGKIYLYIGDVYNYYLATFYGTGNVQAYVYTNGHLREYHQDSATVGGHTVAKDVPSNAVFTDNNTTYTFANGTNGFTVTPSGGSAQTVTVTPSITNNVTGSGTSGYLTKFNGANTITNGPQLGSDTTKFLRNDGAWAVPSSGGVSGNKIFLVQPTPPYSEGDLWLVEDNNISVCINARASGSFDSDDWGSAVDAVDSDTLQSAISSAISSTLTIVTGAGTDGGNVMWRLNNNVPYELLVTDTPTNITSNTAKIYRWDANGLRFSSTGYNGTYSTLINTSGQIPAQYLTGNLDAGVVAIQNFTAAMIHGGVLTRGKANNQDGTIELYGSDGTLIAEVTNLGFKYYGQGTGSTRPYYLINTSGFIGYTYVNNAWTQTVKVAFDEFRMVKGYVQDEFNIGNMIKIIPVNNGTNAGIAFVAAT